MQNHIKIGSTYRNHNSTQWVIPSKIEGGKVFFVCTMAWHPCMLGAGFLLLETWKRRGFREV